MKRLFRKTAILFAMLVATAYLVFRYTTLDLSSPSSTFISWLLYAAEIFGGFTLGLYFFDVWDPKEPPACEPLPNRTVDILVPTYNEDAQLLRNTLTACLRMEYPHKTYVLDDGDRPAIRALAEELGVGYLVRTDRSHAKAGNLNNALQHTTGEFIAIFDADHVPDPHFITRLLGYFKDPKLAFVQTPHAFYNLQSFQSIFDYGTKSYWDEQHLFYKVIEPGKNTWNAATFCGSAALFRREALAEVGGIAVETITEDFHTGLRMHAGGWNSLFVNERLIMGQGAPDVTTFHTQRLRWGEGNLSVLAYDNPLTMRGLKFGQRLSYLGSLLNWCTGIPKLAIYLTPLFVLTTGFSPVNEFSPTLMAVIVLYLTTVISVTKLVSNGYGSVMAAELYSMVNFWTQCRATARALFGRRRQTFVVTSKRGRQSKSIWPYIMPQVLLVFGTVLALAWGWLRQGLGLTEDWLAPLLASFWAVFHAGLALVVIQRALEIENHRFAYRHTAFFPVHYQFKSWDQRPLEGIGLTADMNEYGMSLTCYQPLTVGQVGELTVSGPDGEITCLGEIRALFKQAGRRAASEAPAYYRYGVKLVDLTAEQGDAFARWTLQYAAPKTLQRLAGKQSIWSRLSNLLRRQSTRREYRMPVALQFDGESAPATLAATEDVNPTAFRVIGQRELAEGRKVPFVIFTPYGELEGAGTVIRSAPMSIGGSTAHETVFEFQNLAPGAAEVRQKLLHSVKNRRSVRDGLTPIAKSPPAKILKPALAAAAALALLLPATMLAFSWFHADDIFLDRTVASGKPLNSDAMAHVERIYANAVSDPTTHTVKMRQLRDLFLRMNRTSEVRELTRVFAKRLPDDLDIQRSYADALNEAGEFDAAQERYSFVLNQGEARGLRPEVRQAAELGRARTYVHAKQFDQGLPLFAAAVQQRPNDRGLSREFAGLLISAKRYDEALKVVQTSQPSVEDRRMLMAIYSARRDFAAAERECRAILSETPNDLQARNELPNLLRYQERYKEAIPLFLERLAAGKADSAQRFIVVEMQLASKDFEGAEVQCRAILAAEPNNAKANRMLADVTYYQKKYEAAIPLYERLLAAAGEDADLRWRLANLYAAANKFPAAERECREILRTRPNAIEATRLLVDVLCARQDFKQAAVYVTQLIQGGDSDPMLKLRAAQLTLWQGDDKGALPMFRALMAVANDGSASQQDVEFKREAARGYLDAAAAQERLGDENRELVERLYRDAMAAQSKDGLMLARLASLFRAFRNLPRAVELLEMATRLKPGDRTIRLQYADALQEKGDFGQADELYRSLLAGTNATMPAPLGALSRPSPPRIQ